MEASSQHLSKLGFCRGEVRVASEGTAISQLYQGASHTCCDGTAQPQALRAEVRFVELRLQPLKGDVDPSALRFAEGPGMTGWEGVGGAPV